MHDKRKLIERVAKGELRVHIDRTLPLAEAADAHAYIEEVRGKIHSARATRKR